MHAWSILRSRGFFLAFFLITSRPAPAATVSVCNEASLLEAMGSSHVKFACDGTITLSGTINTHTDVTMDASGRNVILSGNSTVRVFEVMPGATLTLVNLTVANGVSTNGSGGGIYNDGTLILVGCTIATNLAIGGRGVDGNTGADGGTSFPGGHGGNGSLGEPAFGGGIYNRGVFLSTNTSFAGNRAVGGSGGAGGAGGLGGRMVDEFGRCRFGLPGGDGGMSGCGGYGMGGAIYNEGEMALVHATFRDNKAEGGQGGLGGLAGSGGCGAARGAPTAGGQGGPGYGGAWFNNGRMTIIDSTAWANQALGGRGGNSPDDPGSPPTPGPGGSGGLAQGGAGFNAGSSTLTQVTLANNRVIGGQSGLGGRFNIFCPAKGGNGGDAQGGGLYCMDLTSVRNATLWNNVAIAGVATNDFSGCPGVIPDRLGTNGSANGSSIVVSNSISLRNTVVGGINVTQCCVGFVLDLGNNLCSDNSASFTEPSSRNNIDPLLGPLANNGGPTLTMSPLPGSPAIDAADTFSSPATDQRGVPRPQGTRADIGAVEVTFLQIERLSSGEMRLRYAGVPGESYSLEGTVQIGDNWSVIESQSAGVNAAIQYSDLPGNAPHRFFRVKSP